MSGDQPTAPPTQSPLSPGVRVTLVLAWLGWILFFLVPLIGSLAAVLVLLLLFIVSASLLHTGSFVAPLHDFALASTIAASVAAAGLIRLLWRWFDRRRTRAAQPAPPAGLSDLLSPGSFLAIGAGTVYLLGRFARAWLPALGSGVLLACLYFFLASGLLWLLRGSGWFARGLFRFAWRSPYRAGALTTLFILFSLPGLVTLVLSSGPAELRRSLTPQTIDADVPDVASTRDGQELRWLLFDLAESLRPEEALRQDARRFLAPLLDRGHSDALAQARPAWDGLTLYAGPGGGFDDDAAQQRFDECVSQLWPDKFAEVERSLRGVRRLPRDELHDVTMDALISTCEAFTRTRYDDLKAVFKTAARRRAIDELRRSNRFIDPDPARDREDASCPTPWDSVDDKFMKESDLGPMEWAGLRPLERAIMVERVFTDATFSMIARQLGISEAKASDTYSNAIKKIKKNLGDRCLHDFW